MLSSNQNYTVSPTSTTTYELTVTANYGGIYCSSTDNITVTVNQLPNVSASGGSSQYVCEGSTVTLSGTGQAHTVGIMELRMALDFLPRKYNYIHGYWYGY